MSNYRLINSTKVKFFLVIFVVFNGHADAEYDAFKKVHKDNSYEYEEYNTIHPIMKISKVDPHAMKIFIDPKTLKQNTSVGIILKKLDI